MLLAVLWVSAGVLTFVEALQWIPSPVFLSWEARFPSVKGLQCLIHLINQGTPITLHLL